MIRIRCRVESASELSGKKGECVVLQHSHAEQGQVVAVAELPQVIRLLVPLEDSGTDAKKPLARGDMKPPNSSSA